MGVNFHPLAVHFAIHIKRRSHPTHFSTEKSAGQGRRRIFYRRLAGARCPHVDQLDRSRPFCQLCQHPPPQFVDRRREMRAFCQHSANFPSQNWKMEENLLTDRLKIAQSVNVHPPHRCKSVRICGVGCLFSSCIPYPAIFHHFKAVLLRCCTAMLPRCCITLLLCGGAAASLRRYVVSPPYHFATMTPLQHHFAAVLPLCHIISLLCCLTAAPHYRITA